MGGKEVGPLSRLRPFQLRLGVDGSILAASHGTKRLTEFEIDKIYGRCRKKHAATDFVQHLNEFGPQKLVEFSPLLHNFMDYFDIAAPLICTRSKDINPIDLRNRIYLEGTLKNFLVSL